MFPTPGQVLACLEGIIGDSSLRVLRIKARLSPDFDSNKSGGYRDVLMNIQFPGAEGELSLFIFEVQLHLQPFLDLKRLGGHKTYEVVRTLRLLDSLVQSTAQHSR